MTSRCHTNWPIELYEAYIFQKIKVILKKNNQYLLKIKTIIKNQTKTLLYGT